MISQAKTVEVYETGRLTVVGFGGREILDQVDVTSCRDELAELVKEHDCETLAFDLTGVRLIPSGFLGILTSLRDLNVEIELYNPSADVREVLEVTNLDRIFAIHEVKV